MSELSQLVSLCVSQQLGCEFHTVSYIMGVLITVGRVFIVDINQYQLILVTPVLLKITNTFQVVHTADYYYYYY